MLVEQIRTGDGQFKQEPPPCEGCAKLRTERDSSRRCLARARANYEAEKHASDSLRDDRDRLRVDLNKTCEKWPTIEEALAERDEARAGAEDYATVQRLERNIAAGREHMHNALTAIEEGD